MRSAVLLALLAPVLSGCHRSEDQVVEVGGVARGRDAARAPRAHSWDAGVSSVPWPAGRDGRSPGFGELGRTASTGLYLTFEGDLASELSAQPEGWSVEVRGVAHAAGRFGRGARFDPGSSLTCTLPEAPPGERVFTVECWLQPGAAVPGPIFELPGFLRVSRDAAGRIFVRVPGAGTDEREGGGFQDLVVGSEGTLLPDEWNHLGVVLDLSELRAVRVVLNGAVQGRRFPVERLPGSPRELRFGDTLGDATGAPVLVDELRVERRNLSTAELMEDHQALPRPRERLVLDYDDGTREELDVWTAPLREPWVADRAAFDRGDLEHAVADDAGLTWTSESWRRIRTSARPLARTTHATAPLGGQRLLLYGGETRDTHFGRIVNTDDTWVFDGAVERWTRVRTTRAPSGRCHVPMAYSPDHAAVLLVGGWMNEVEPGETYRDTWLFRVGAMDWEPRSSSGLAMTTVVDHALVYLPALRRFLLIAKPSSFLYDPDGDVWTELPRPRVVDERGDPTVDPPRYSRSAVVDARGRVFLFGGYRPDEFLDTTAVYDVETNIVTVLDPPVRPAARVRPGLAYDPVRDRVVLFGGVLDQRSQRFEDLWVFDLAARTWREVPRGQGRPRARGGYYGMDYDAVADRFVLTHGRHSFERFLDETWVLTLDERRPGRARHAFDRAGFEERRFDAEVEAPGDARVAFRFRGGDDPLRPGPWGAEPPPGTRYVEVETELVPGTRGEVPRVRAMGWRR